MIGVVLVCHEYIAAEYLKAVKTATECNASRLLAFTVRRNDDTDNLRQRIRSAIEALLVDDGVLVLTDQKGSTPANLAVQAAKGLNNVVVIAGLNMAMLIRVLDRREHPTDLKALAESAVEAGKEAVEQLLTEEPVKQSNINQQPVEEKQTVIKEIEVVNKLGLHAAAAAKLVHLANQFEADITISKNGKKVNAKSILGVLTLVAAKGEKVVVEAKGKDAQKAIDAIAELFARKFDEPE